MLELGFNVTEYGKAILAACFINDLGTVIALGLIFSPFTIKTLIFVVVSIVVFVALPFLTPWFFKKYGGRVSELEAKYLLFFLFAMGGLAVWAGSEAVLPAYMIGMVLAGTVGKDHSLIRRLRTLTFGLLTPFYFIRAGSFVSVPALMAAPVTLLVLFGAKSLFKVVAVYPAVRIHKYDGNAGAYYTLMMSTGLTFGTISALFGLSLPASTIKPHSIYWIDTASRISTRNSTARIPSSSRAGSSPLFFHCSSGEGPANPTGRRSLVLLPERMLKSIQNRHQRRLIHVAAHIRRDPRFVPLHMKAQPHSQLRRYSNTLKK
jgi:Kef-type K+ transport system membrane component KefB